MRCGAALWRHLLLIEVGVMIILPLALPPGIEAGPSAGQAEILLYTTGDSTGRARRGARSVSVAVDAAVGLRPASGEVSADNGDLPGPNTASSASSSSCSAGGTEAL